jgi:hypothetical protein
MKSYIAPGILSAALLASVIQCGQACPWGRSVIIAQHGAETETRRMTIGLTCRRTARKIKRLRETVLTISPDYSIARFPTFWRSPLPTSKVGAAIMKSS